MPQSENERILDELRDVRVELGVINRSLDGNKPKDEGPTSIIKYIAGILSLVAVAFGILYTASQTINQFTDTEKTRIDTELSRLEIEEKRIEIKKAVRELADKDSQEMIDKGSEARALLGEIDRTLNSLREAESAFRVDDMITKFIFLWAGFLFIGLVSEVVSTIWTSVVGSIVALIHQIEAIARHPLTKRFRTIVNLGQLFLMLLPNIFFITLRFSLFTAVVAPFLLRIAALNPHEMELRIFLDSLTNYNFLGAINALSQMFL